MRDTEDTAATFAFRELRRLIDRGEQALVPPELGRAATSANQLDLMALIERVSQLPLKDVARVFVWVIRRKAGTRWRRWRAALPIRSGKSIS